MVKKGNTFTVAVIGGGFCGTVVATHLLLNPMRRPMRVVLIDRMAERFARGIAYGTNNFLHQLNVPAGRMSAFKDDADHFLRWAARRALNLTAQTFVPRRIYGEYLSDMLTEAAIAAPEENDLMQVVDDVVEVEPEAGSETAAVNLQTNGTVLADRVVLALGHAAPADLDIGETDFHASRRYVRNPWADDALGGVAVNDAVLLIGTGLTMVDVALTLKQRGHRAPIYAISRRGLLPQVFQQTQHPSSFEFNLESPITLRKLLSAVRDEIRAAAVKGYDWRAVIESLRPITPDLWKILGEHERRRFLRHLRPFWEAHRHQMPPEVAAAISGMQTVGQLSIRAGYIKHFRESSGAVEVVYRKRGTSEIKSLQVAHVINCTGPAADVTRIDDSLIVYLRERGHVRPGPLGLGLDATDEGALTNARGEISERLFTIGPLRKGRLWETTAVTELRAQAAALARTLCHERTGPPSKPQLVHPVCTKGLED